jgi:ferrous iron transport protein B
VGTLAVCYGISNLIDTDALEMVEGAGAEVAAIFGITKVAALAYLVFNLFSPPCFAAIGAMNAEITDKKWLFGGIGLQLGTGYTVGYLVYTIGTLITAPESLNVVAAVGGGLFVAAFAGVLTALCLRSDKQVKAEAAVSGRR